MREFSITDVVPFPITLRWKSPTDDGLGWVIVNALKCCMTNGYFIVL